MRICIIFLLMGSGIALASTSNHYLQRAINELEAAKVYGQKAKMYEPAHSRMVFHYDRVLADINQIESGIERKFHMPHIQPRRIHPIQGDYLSVVGKGDLA